MLASLIFVVSALLELAFVVLLSRVPSLVEKSSHKSTPGKEPDSNSEGLSWINIASKESSTPTMVDAKKDLVRHQKIMKAVSSMPPIHVVDLISFCFYIVFFISFNVIYWISY